VALRPDLAYADARKVCELAPAVPAAPGGDGVAGITFDGLTVSLRGMPCTG
jgi:hypothetical protein